MALVVGIEPTSSRLELEMLPLHQTNMEEDVGFEPTEPCGPSAFKADAINRTLPIFHKIVSPTTLSITAYIRRISRNFTIK